MKLRHAAALALVGWYLLLPPLSTTVEELRAGDVPSLAKWRQWWAFDTAKECEHERVQQAESSKTEGNVKASEAFFWSRCIASDDPRLIK